MKTMRVKVGDNILLARGDPATMSVAQTIRPAFLIKIHGSGTHNSLWDMAARSLAKSFNYLYLLSKGLEELS